MTKFSRRHFLGTGAALGASAVISNAGLADTPVQELDVAVIGGGVAGLYSAYRLRTETKARVAVFESTDRIGGRLVSLHFPGLSNQTAEVGGMRLRQSDDIALKIITDLIGRDHLQTFDYPPGWYLRDRSLASLGDAGALPYGLDPTERAIIDRGDDLLTVTIDEIKTRVAKGASFDGVWEMLLKTRSKEGVNFVKDSLGYFSVVSNWDAKAAMPWFTADFAPGTSYYKLKGGLERIPFAVASGSEIHLNTALQALGRLKDGRIELVFQTPDGPRRVHTSQVILALPPHAIEQLDPASLVFEDPRFRAEMQSVHKVPLGKIHLSFPSDWWSKAGLKPGHMITDLPMRQGYRWGTDPETGQALFMAYFDQQMIDYWDALAVGPGYGGDWITQATGPDGKPLPLSLQRRLPASEAIVEEMCRQIQVTHGLSADLPRPLAGTYQNWGDAPWGAAVHFWAVGSDPDASMAYLQEPYPGLHVCNEAWSHAQGWVRGATDTAEMVLQSQFGLPAFVSN